MIDALTMWLFGVPAFPFGMMILFPVVLAVVWLIAKLRGDE